MCPICHLGQKISNLASLNSNQEIIKESYEYHYEQKKARRIEYKEQLKNLDSSELLLVMDFKANISLQQCATELNNEYYALPQRSIFCISANFRYQNTVKQVFFDFISNILNHSTKFVGECLKYMINSSIFKQISSGIKKISIWVDNGPQHFRTYEMLGLCQDLSSSLGTKIDLNFFVPYHGKC